MNDAGDSSGPERHRRPPVRSPRPPLRPPERTPMIRRPMPRVAAGLIPALTALTGLAQNPPSPTPTSTPAPASASTPAAPEKKYRDFGEVAKGAEKIDGLFTLYKKDDHLYA